MLSFIIRRVVSGVVLVAVISAVAFLLLYAGGGDIARRILGENATAETVAKKTEELGLNRPLLTQYTDWLMSAVSGNLGRSWFTGELVSVSVANRLAVTLSLVIGATLISAVIAIVIGVLAARRGGAIDGTVQFLSLVGFAVPGFLIALILVSIFAVNLHWFKATGYVPIATSFSGWIASVTLPIIALSIGAIASVAVQVRGSVIDATSRDYVRTLRARGLSERSVIYKHVLRNAGGPALAVLALQFVGLLGGAVVVEQIFAIPGMGQLFVTSIQRVDVNPVMGYFIVIAITAILFNFLADLAYAALDPRVRVVA